MTPSLLRLISRPFVFVLFFLAFTSVAFGQFTFSGLVLDASSKETLPFVNIGIKNKNIGTSSGSNGAFAINLSRQYERDTLTFSMVGYRELNIAVRALQNRSKDTIQLIKKNTVLREVTVSAGKWVEKKFGIKSHNPILTFEDGSTNQNDIFEIGQLIKLGGLSSRITSVNLFVTRPRKDSGTFRINFYGFDGHRPTGRKIEKNIYQNQAIKPGWLKFNLSPYHIYLKGDIIVSIEFFPAAQKNMPIFYEIKLGGSSRSFVRTSSLGEWKVPVHHYRLFVTALGSREEGKSGQDDSEENETLSTTRLFSAFVGDSFSIFIHLPEGYIKNKHKVYPTAYLLDANVYYDQVHNIVKHLNATNQLPEMILVGIGYKDFLTMDSLRNRDYTFPEAPAEDSFFTSGGGEKFRNFLHMELIPLIDRNYRTDLQNRTIMGHSLGGYFVLFNLETDLKEHNVLFKNYLAASPSLSYSHGYLINQFQNLVEKDTGQISRRLYLTTGSFEGGEKGGVQFNQLIHILSGSKFDHINLKHVILGKTDHMETAIPSFENGLQVMKENQH